MSQISKYPSVTRDIALVVKDNVLAGDIICEMDGTSIDTYEDLQGVLQYFAPGSSTTLTVMRQMDGAYTEVELNITFGERP